MAALSITRTNVTVEELRAVAVVCRILAIAMVLAGYSREAAQAMGSCSRKSWPPSRRFARCRPPDVEDRRQTRPGPGFSLAQRSSTSWQDSSRLPGDVTVVERPVRPLSCLLDGRISRSSGEYRLTIAYRGSDAVLCFDPTGNGSGATVAVLQGLANSVTGLDTLIAQGAIRIA